MSIRLVAGLLVLVAGAGAAEKLPEALREDAPAPPPRMRQPEHLPAAARMLLLERMGNHRQDVSALQAAVIFLEHEAVEALAERLAREPRLAPPGPGGADELNSLVPPRFFELQDELRAKARRLGEAARAGDDAAIARAYGSLAETCVECHAVYLRPPAP